MTDEVRAVFGKDLKIKLKTKGDYRFFQNYINKTPPPKLSGVRALYLRFFDGKLYQIEVFYEKEFSLTLEDFTEMIARQLNFSPAEWIYENKAAAIRCQENAILADYVLNPRIQLTNETVLTKVNEINETK